MAHDSDIFRHGFAEYQRFVNPLIASRALLAREPMRMLHTKGGLLVDDAGREYEDFHGTQAFGHRHPAITAAAIEFLNSDRPSWYPSRVAPHSGRLARVLCERTGYEQVWFGCSGSDAVEAALKLARCATRRPRILSLTGAYHGCNMGSTGLMTEGPFRDPFGPHVEGFEALPFGDTDALHRAFAAGAIAAVVVEPIQGEGGVRKLPDDYVAALCAFTARHDALLIADEVQTSFGRTGRFLLTAEWPRRPDIVLIAKALGGGLMPISALLTRMDVFKRAYGAQFEAAESHNMTFSYNALGAVTALAALELLTDELIAEVRRKGDAFRAALAAALADSPLFLEVRGEGLMVGVKFRDFSNRWLSFDAFGFAGLEGRSAIGPILATRLYERGYYAFVCGHDWSILRLQPRLGIESAKLSAFTQILRQELAFLEELE